MVAWRALALWLLAASAGAGVVAQQNVTITRMQLELEETHELHLDTSVEFILDFNPNDEQARWPMRVWVDSDAGHPSRPLILTYRQRAGAGTWQLPWSSGSHLRFELERTLCADDAVDETTPDCEQEGGARGWISLHVVASCASRVRLRVRPARDWRLRDSLHSTATLLSPRVHHYSFPEGQTQVRLVASSEDDVCATLAVQQYGCPIAETLQELSTTTMRMSMQRSGAVQLSRERFPRGFLVLVLVHETDEACENEQPAHEDWLWAAAVYGPDPARPHPPRTKTVTLAVQEALSREQYAIAAVATLAVFLSVYAAFGVVVLLQRWPPFRRLVEPRAVLAPKPDPDASQSQTDTAHDGSRRRDSTATFDSSDNSDSDSDVEGVGRSTPAPSIVQQPNTTPSIGTPPNNVLPIANPPNTTPSIVNPPTDSIRSVAGIQASATNNVLCPDNTGNDGPSRDVGTIVTQATISRTTSEPSSPASRTAASGHTPGGENGAVTSDTDINRVTFIDTANEQTGGVEPNGTQSPFGLPARLHVAALSRRRARVLKARADRYLTTLLTVAVFYSLPVLQIVFTFQIFVNVSGSLDVCYYNFLCAHPAGLLSDFNHVYSNLGYLLLGALFILQLQRRRRARALHPRHEDYGIPAHYGLLAALGAGMMVVALLSASYHVCPNRLNFQFDTSFMYVLAVLSMVKIYQSRHPDVNARAHATFGVLAVLIALVVWGVVGGGALFWGVFTVLHVFTFLLLSLRIYYLGQFRFEKETIQRAARQLRDNPGLGLRPLYTARLVLLLIANALNWAIALLG
ncbi:hypothetical protein evm_010016 [Chilo suppressalis]|nr:hypothetical protein evm_010016 [Chilo suppressalis]